MPDAAVAEPYACGDDLACMEVGDVSAAQRLAAQLRGDPLWLEVVPGFTSVTVQFDPLTTSIGRATSLLSAAASRMATAGLPPGSDMAESSALEIPVRYGGEDGPDLEAVCAQLGLSPAAFVAAHTGHTCRVELLGFTPGFAYIGGLDAALDVPRLTVPRPRVPAGAVGIAGRYTGLYALAGPGGWPLVGRATLPLFDAAAANPFRLKPGQRLRFRAEEAGKP